MIGHRRIQAKKPELFQSDGVHLSDAGLDVFLEDMGGVCLPSSQGSVVGMGHSQASPYAVVGSAEKLAFLVGNFK